MPNVSKGHTFHFDSVRIECNCGCRQGVEIFYDKDDNDLWFNVIRFPVSLWQAIKWWWHQWKVYSMDMQINDEDLVKIKEWIEKRIK